MRKHFLILLLFVVPLIGKSQQSILKSFFQLSFAEKKWTMGHLFIAKKAWTITQRCRYVTDSLGKLGVPDRDPSGGKLDAFRHTFWMATLSVNIGVKKSLSLGRAHERGDYRNFKHHRFEEGDIPDKAAGDMDLYNNIIGAGIGSVLKGANEKVIVDSILKAISQGSMRIILKDKLGRSCDADFNPIPIEKMHGKWVTPRVLVPSDILLTLKQKKY
jgi:hypothetical protein